MFPKMTSWLKRLCRRDEGLPSPDEIRARLARDIESNREEWEQHRRELEARPTLKIWELTNVRVHHCSKTKLPEWHIDIDDFGRLWFWSVGPAMSGTPIEAGRLYAGPLLRLAFKVVASAELRRVGFFHIPGFDDGGDDATVWQSSPTRANLLALLASNLGSWSVEARDAAERFRIATEEILAVRAEMASARFLPGLPPWCQPWFPEEFFELGQVPVPDVQWTEEEIRAFTDPRSLPFIAFGQMLTQQR